MIGFVEDDGCPYCFEGGCGTSDCDSVCGSGVICGCPDVGEGGCETREEDEGWGQHGDDGQR